MCVLKNERNYQFFKRLAHQVCNIKNICRTMINRHQLEHFLHWSSSDSSVATEFGPGSWVPSNHFFANGNLNLFQENFNPEDDKIYECKRAKKSGVCFKFCDVVIINYNTSTETPVFLKIEKLLRVQDQLVFFGNILEVVKYSTASRSYLTTETAVSKFVSHNSLFDYHCFSIHRCFDQTCRNGHIVLRKKLHFNNFACLQAKP